MQKKFEIRNSTTEFLIFQIEGKEDGVQVVYHNESVWCTQKAMAQFLELTDRPVLTDAEKITAEFAKSSLNRSLRNIVSLRTNSFSQTSTISTMTTFSL